ncbi:MAG: hypothetical protein LBR68_04130 [Lachnoclostridium sp.]|jgi:hypothetical protein|nr:hypothetical protein [Lachnoclostridium sp.]
MKKGIIIFTKSILSFALEVIIFAVILIGVAFLQEEVKQYSSIAARFLLYFYCIAYILYLIFSNIKYRSLTSLILGFTLETKRSQMIRIPIGNLYFYGLFSIFTWFQIEKITNPIFYIMEILIIIEMITCFIPKISTRCSLFLLQINWTKVKKERKELPNDGILL